MHSSTIHSGRLSLSRRASTTLSRLVRSFTFCLLEVSTSSCRSCFESATRSSRSNSFLTASAPMSAWNSSLYWPPSLYCSFALRNSSSVKSCRSLSGVSPGSTTT